MVKLVAWMMPRRSSQYAPTLSASSGTFRPHPIGNVAPVFFDHLFGFIERVNRKRDYIGIFLFEFFDMRLEVGYLPNAVRSPHAAIENDDGIVAFEIGWDV